jgi:hypothetical protein
MEYLSVAQARSSGGLRLVLTVAVPGPWSESAKQILDYKQISYAPVAQYLNQENTDLLAWVGVRNASRHDLPSASEIAARLLDRTHDRPLLLSQSQYLEGHHDAGGMRGSTSTRRFDRSSASVWGADSIGRVGPDRITFGNKPGRGEYAAFHQPLPHGSVVRE